MEDIICLKCGSINDYWVKETDLHSTAYCNCGAYIKHLPKGNIEDLRMYIGKYKGKLITEIEDLNYLEWAIKNISFKDKYKTAITNRIDTLKLITK